MPLPTTPAPPPVAAAASSPLLPRLPPPLRVLGVTRPTARTPPRAGRHACSTPVVEPSAFPPRRRAMLSDKAAGGLGPGERVGKARGGGGARRRARAWGRRAWRRADLGSAPSDPPPRPVRARSAVRRPPRRSAAPPLLLQLGRRRARRPLRPPCVCSRSPPPDHHTAASVPRARVHLLTPRSCPPP